MKTRLIDAGVAALMLPGQRVSGDRQLVKPFDGGVLIAVVDGLGHGMQAAAAADMAVCTLERYAQEPVISLVNRCQTALRHTRGAVMSLATFNAVENTMTWLGVGNVEGVLLRRETASGTCDESLLLRPGVVGRRLPDLNAAVLTVKRDDVLILASDGIRSGFAKDVILTDQAQIIADRILSTHGKSTDDALVLVSRYLGTVNLPHDQEHE